MPEGDTVWNTARVLQRALAGARLTGSDFRVPQLAATDLTGWTVRESASRGKHLLLRLTAPPDAAAAPAGATAGADVTRADTTRADATQADATRADATRPDTTRADATRAAAASGRDWTLHSHLRMDGAWRAYAPGERWAARPAHLIRVVLRSPGAVAVGYHLHELALIPTAEEESLVGHLGPDLLGPDWDPEEAVRRLAAHPDETIGEALLDQRNLAGVGNLYKCEVLFLRGVSPWTPVRAVPDLAGTVGLAQRLLAANRGRWTQSTTGSLHRGQTSYVYGRRAQPCRRCGTAIRKEELGERVTYWCPACQPDH
ncbi:Fpg/Nei family DNA glycosylase [Micromonospora sp. AP08]|uniref:zinc finger domain-containing protein n=1 Tax=Micromonospora sp. AP08 TaxID=2604467 RepID=UPI0011DACAB6|nr:zinc finger domain-containing protein [Micromonospora sp. AP08]TYB37506.1 Fpg/Nei family DNA glycosylase [Micromonospora sp. AP08]